MIPKNSEHCVQVPSLIEYSSTTCNSLGLISNMQNEGGYCWKCRPQSDHVGRIDLAKRFFIAGWERERAERERERGGQGLKYPSVRLGMI
jgi:hypothetical protein